MGRWGEAIAGVLLLATVAFGSIDSAEAKTTPATALNLTIEARVVPSQPEDVAGGFPPKGTALSGRLTSPVSACMRNRLITGVYEYPWRADKGPVEESLGVWTKPSGRWSTQAVPQFYSSYGRRTVEAHVVTERTQLASGKVCPAVESETIKVKAHKLVPCSLETACRMRARGDRARPTLVHGTMTVRTKEIPSPFPPELIEAGYPAEATILHGRLRTGTPACRRNRQVFLTFRFPPSYEPVSRNYRIRTDAAGRWEARDASPGASSEPEVVRVTAAVKRRSVGAGLACARVESPETNIKQQRINTCVLDNSCLSPADRKAVLRSAIADGARLRPARSGG